MFIFTLGMEQNRQQKNLARREKYAEQKLNKKKSGK
jgi:hypothetical protein